MIDFRTHPGAYRHWKITTDGPIARLDMAVDPDGGIHPGYELKLNSYDLGVDIELYDAVQRLRFEHPDVGTGAEDAVEERTDYDRPHLGMLEAEALNGVVQLDVHPQVV